MITPMSAFGNLPSRICFPERTADWPVVVDVSNTAPVPIFDRLPAPPAPEAAPIPVAIPIEVPKLVAAKSETPFKAAFPPTETDGRNDCKPSAPRTLELAV